jgi:micrococcal nuclease
MSAVTFKENDMGKTFAAFLIGLDLCGGAHADTRLTGMAVRVLDGDTAEILTADKQRIRVRLANIDAPEKSQAFGQRSKENLTDLIAGKQVDVLDQGGDQYGRRIGRIYVGNTEANVEQVRAGMAWVYTRYNHDPALPVIQAQAR